MKYTSILLMVRAELVFKYHNVAIEKIYDAKNWYQLSQKYLRDDDYNHLLMVFVKWNCWTYNQFYSELEEELKQNFKQEEK